MISPPQNLAARPLFRLILFGLLLCAVGVPLWSGAKAEAVWKENEGAIIGRIERGRYTDTTFDEALFFFVDLTDLRIGIDHQYMGNVLMEDPRALLVRLRAWHSTHRLYWSFVHEEVRVLPKSPIKALWRWLFVTPESTPRRGPEVYRSPAT